MPMNCVFHFYNCLSELIRFVQLIAENVRKHEEESGSILGDKPGNLRNLAALLNSGTNLFPQRAESRSTLASLAESLKKLRAHQLQEKDVKSMSIIDEIIDELEKEQLEEEGADARAIQDIPIIGDIIKGFGSLFG